MRHGRKQPGGLLRRGAGRHAARPRVNARGFTLVELLVAATVGALALAAAHATLAQLAPGAEAVARAAAAADRDANAERLLRQAVLGLDVGVGREFDGDAAGARFLTWCDVPAGWRERCAAHLIIDSVVVAPVGDSGGRAPALVLALTPTDSAGRSAVRPDTVVLRTGLAHAALRYLADPGTGGRWMAAWARSVTAPAALGVVLDADTLILRVGARG